MYNIITLNTWKCEGDYLKRLNALTRHVREYDPDILLLQEAFQTLDNEFDTTRQIANDTGLTGISSTSRQKKRFLYNNYKDSYSNVSILSKFPILNYHTISLPSNKEDGGREAILAEIKLHNHLMLVCSLHLSHLKDGARLRLEQLLHILDHASLKKNYDGILLGGDFNMEVTNQDFDSITREGYRIYDTFTPKENLDNHTLNTFNRKVKIDHILELRKSGLGIKVNHSCIVFQNPCNEFGIKISDHNGVLLNFSFE
ncbi:MAG: hypothetical protein HC905_13675 [Bacteroidales bacterium]|nr:hypothetical protein [Bacteroidales bacterium]